MSNNFTYITSDVGFKNLLRYYIRKLVFKINYLKHIEPTALYKYELYKVFAIENSQITKKDFFLKVEDFLTNLPFLTNFIDTVVQTFFKAVGLNDSDKKKNFCFYSTTYFENEFDEIFYL